MSESPPPCVTIGLPIYNGGTFLNETLEALLGQDYPNLQIVISDNCSTDDTQAICERFALRDERIRYHRNERNLGAAANFNKVVALAEGQYFAWANHDDLWHDSYISRCVAELESRPDAVLAYSRSAKIDGAGAQVAPLMKDLGLRSNQPSKRLRQYHDLFIEVDHRKMWSSHEIEGLWIPVYGVVRTRQLLETEMIGPYINSDTILLEELLMRGSFIEIDDCLFFKRDHDERSMRASLSYDRRIDWFTGRKAGLFIFPRWRLLRERMLAVSRSPLASKDKNACYREMSGFYFRRPHEGKALVKEILVNGARVARPILERLPLGDRVAPKKW